jgi:hypothetical protein
VDSDSDYSQGGAACNAWTGVGDNVSSFSEAELSANCSFTSGIQACGDQGLSCN